MPHLHPNITSIPVTLDISETIGRKDRGAVLTFIPTRKGLIIRLEEAQVGGDARDFKHSDPPRGFQKTVGANKPMISWALIPDEKPTQLLYKKSLTSFRLARGSELGGLIRLVAGVASKPDFLSKFSGIETQQLVQRTLSTMGIGVDPFFKHR